MLKYRKALAEDTQTIANLHAQSWSDNYRGSFEDTYLDGPVFTERLEVWKKRFANPDPNMHVILSEDEGKAYGFVCLFLDNDLRWGSLIDNLHVTKSAKGKGIGKTLMNEAFTIIKENARNDRSFLYVLTKNKEAINFYKKLGGFMEGTELFENPGGGGTSEVYRFTWG